MHLSLCVCLSFCLCVCLPCPVFLCSTCAPCGCFPPAHPESRSLAVLAPLQDVDVGAGEMALFECLVAGPADVEVDWLCRGRLLQPALLKCKMHFDGRKCKLLLTSVHEDDSGVYTCKLSTAKGNCPLGPEGCRRHPRAGGRGVEVKDGPRIRRPGRGAPSPGRRAVGWEMVLYTCLHKSALVVAAGTQHVLCQCSLWFLLGSQLLKCGDHTCAWVPVLALPRTSHVTSDKSFHLSEL